MEGHELGHKLFTGSWNQQSDMCVKNNSTTQTNYYQMETSLSTVEKEFESCHIVLINNTEVPQYMAGIAWTPIYLPVHVLRFESQNEQKLDMIRYLGWKYIKLFAFYKYLQQTTSVWKINLHIYEITYGG